MRLCRWFACRATFASLDRARKNGSIYGDASLFRWREARVIVGLIRQKGDVLLALLSLPRDQRKRWADRHMSGEMYRAETSAPVERATRLDKFLSMETSVPKKRNAYQLEER